MVTGVICEYNPFHLGHKKQLDAIRASDPEGAIVCLMSGNYVQRGAPAIVDKAVRARAAIMSGADLVLEMPVTYSLRSAEGYAAGGVSILSPICDRLCFGAEDPNAQQLISTAKALLSESFSFCLRSELEKGLSFPAAREAALKALEGNYTPLNTPNNILAVEYCKAILSQKSDMQPMPIQRDGSYHADYADPENPSATFLRSCMAAGQDFSHYMPEHTARLYKTAPLHSLSAGERAVLYRLRTMTDDEFKVLPYGSEGLWRKLMHASRKCATLNEIMDTVKSKRYTRTRLDRMVMCAALGITNEILEAKPPYVRVLALSDKGRQVLRTARDTGWFPNTGEAIDHAYQTLENRAGDLYGLFCVNAIEPSGSEKKNRIFCKK